VKDVRHWDPVIPIDNHVPQVPDYMLQLDDYKLLFNHPWRVHEAIHMLEGRAALKGGQHACRSPSCRYHRVLMLCDNMSVVTAFNKGRCQNHALLRLTRKLASFALCHNIFFVTAMLSLLEMSQTAPPGLISLLKKSASLAVTKTFGSSCNHRAKNRGGLLAEAPTCELLRPSEGGDGLFLVQLAVTPAVRDGYRRIVAAFILFCATLQLP
jgi:hypothetical protein